MTDVNGDPAAQRTPSEALELLLIITCHALGGPAPGSVGHSEWLLTREGRVLAGLYNDVKIGLPRELNDNDRETLDELTLEFYDAGEE